MAWGLGWTEKRVQALKEAIFLTASIVLLSCAMVGIDAFVPIAAPLLLGPVSLVAAGCSAKLGICLAEACAVEQYTKETTA